MMASSDAPGGVSEMIASAPLEPAYFAYSSDLFRSKPTVCTPSTTAALPLTDSSASAPACHSSDVSVCHALAFCGHAMPATLPRLRNFCCATIESRSSLSSGVHGDQPIGNTPASALPFGDLAIAAASALPIPPTAMAPATAPATVRKVRRFVEFDMDDPPGRVQSWCPRDGRSVRHALGLCQETTFQ